MFSQIFDAIEEWMRELLTGMITSNLDTMFTDVNQKTGEIATQVGQTPQGWNGSIFSMIRNLSDSVIMPIAGIIITLVLCYELISMLTERNNMHDIDTWMFFKYFVKMWIAVYLVSNTFTITMAVFDVGQHVVNSAAGVISGSTAIDISSALTDLSATLESMEIGELVVLALETLIAGFCMRILSVLITVIMYGRMIEIYLYTSVAPIPFATMSNREWGQIGTNYFRGLFALAFLVNILDFFICFHDSIWYSKCSVTGIIAVLQRCTHVLYFVLMPCDLCQEASACTNNSHGNDHEFLYGWMGKACNVFYGFLTVGLMVKIHQIGHVLDRMTVLCEPGCKDHILFCFPDSIAV